MDLLVCVIFNGKNRSTKHKSEMVSGNERQEMSYDAEYILFMHKWLYFELFLYEKNKMCF